MRGGISSLMVMLQYGHFHLYYSGCCFVGPGLILLVYACGEWVCLLQYLQKDSLYWVVFFATCLIGRVNNSRMSENTDAKLPSQMHYFWHFLPYFFQSAFTPTSVLLFTFEREVIFQPNCSKFAFECDCTRKNSEKVQKSVIFQKKILKILRVATCGNFLKNGSQKVFYFWNFFPPYFGGFWRKSEKIEDGKVRKSYEETNYFEKQCFQPSKRHL